MKLAEYMNNSVIHIFRDAIRSSQFNMKEILFLNRAAKAQKAAAQRRLQSNADGISVPPFLIASISTKCNLHCAGCYARANHACADESSKKEMEAHRWGELFKEAHTLGISFVLLSGGEPLERPEVLQEAVKIPELIFPVFTNGTLFTPIILEYFDQNRNLIPVISMEGNRQQTDHRRGDGIFEATVQTMREMTLLGLFYGVSITVTKGNLDTVTDDTFVASLKEIGCHLIFLVEYVPADGNIEPALDEKQRLVLETRQSELKTHFSDMLILSFPGDEKRLGGCLAAGRGFFHINASGDAEPCPFSPYSDINLKTNTLRDALDSTLFHQIRENHFEEQNHEGGCVLFPRQAEIENLLTIEK
ncbi:radical SAM protein [uncultured Sphaerochaeta sp.]|uniref:radical SAM protein n=1 Tax=uncultured Sphaerochaeta sp. TaxID=886478 RepID=UPI002A0A17A5|nr:radical SAM protein [uncultured Sphaerochaeta sp.]